MAFRVAAMIEKEGSPMMNRFEAYEIQQEPHDEVFVVVWETPKAPGVEITTECYNIDDLMLYIRSHISKDIVITSVNGMPVVNVDTVEVVKVVE